MGAAWSRPAKKRTAAARSRGSRRKKIVCMSTIRRPSSGKGTPIRSNSGQHGDVESPDVVAREVGVAEERERAPTRDRGTAEHPSRRRRRCRGRARSLGILTPGFTSRSKIGTPSLAKRTAATSTIRSAACPFRSSRGRRRRAALGAELEERAESVEGESRVRHAGIMAQLARGREARPPTSTRRPAGRVRPDESRGVQDRRGRSRRPRRVVERVAEERRSEEREVDAQLVHPSRPRLQLDERRGPAILEDTIRGPRFAAGGVDDRAAGRRDRRDRADAPGRQEVPCAGGPVGGLEGAPQSSGLPVRCSSSFSVTTPSQARARRASRRGTSSRRRTATRRARRGAPREFLRGGGRPRSPCRGGERGRGPRRTSPEARERSPFGPWTAAPGLVHHDIAFRAGRRREELHARILQRRQDDGEAPRDVRRHADHDRRLVEPDAVEEVDELTAEKKEIRRRWRRRRELLLFPMRSACGT